MRQPLEDGWVTISRATTTISFPARFMLAAAMNPCPCGFLGDPLKSCSCTPVQVQRYQSRISGPLLDRFDLQIEVPRLQEFEFETVKSGESSLKIRHRVERARQIQRQRYQGSSGFCNAAMTHKQIREFCRIDAAGQSLLRQALQRFRTKRPGLQPDS